MLTTNLDDTSLDLTEDDNMKPNGRLSDCEKNLDYLKDAI